MKKTILIFCLAILSVCGFGSQASAQKNIEPQVQRDPALEADAIHNLQVAQQYFRLKKAYKAVLLRLEETMAANPDFSQMDQVLYLAGMSSYYLADNKGKQKIDLAKASDEDKKKYAPEKLREDAIAYLSLLIEKYPQSERKPDAEKTLAELKNKPAGKQ